VAKLLGAHRDKPAADVDAICRTLVQLAQLVADIAEVMEIDINPLLANSRGVIALDARIRVGHADAAGSSRLAIRPYPSELEETLNLVGKRLLLRPIRPSDAPQLSQLVAQCKPEDRHFRFFTAIRDLPNPLLGRYTQIDYEREMAFVAVGAENELFGEIRTVADPDNGHAEFAILVRSEYQGKGLGHALLEKMIRYCGDRGIKTMFGDVLASNSRMLELAETFQFRHQSQPVDGVIRISLKLFGPGSNPP
jgi:acetyltransferase